jgi:hypothetical protein
MATFIFNGISYKTPKRAELYMQLCLIGGSMGMLIGGIAGVTIAAASPAIVGYYAIKAIANRLTTT